MFACWRRFDWDKVTESFAGERKAEIRRITEEPMCMSHWIWTERVCDVSTGLAFFDHMLEQLGKHSGMDITIRVDGDLNVDEHHNYREDTGIALGDCIYQALGSKRGIERYGYALADGRLSLPGVSRLRRTLVACMGGGI